MNERNTFFSGKPRMSQSLLRSEPLAGIGRQQLSGVCFKRKLREDTTNKEKSKAKRSEANVMRSLADSLTVFHSGYLKLKLAFSILL